MSTSMTREPSRRRGTRSSVTGAHTALRRAKLSAPKTTTTISTTAWSRCRRRTSRIFRPSYSANRAQMRPITIILALFLAGGPTAAQSWKEYAYPADFFSVAFPTDPKVETTTYQAADGRAAEARVYSVSQDGGVFRMTVADLPDPTTQENAVLDHAVRMLSHGSEIKVDI